MNVGENRGFLLRGVVPVDVIVQQLFSIRESILLLNVVQRPLNVSLEAQ